MRSHSQSEHGGGASKGRRCDLTRDLFSHPRIRTPYRSQIDTYLYVMYRRSRVGAVGCRAQHSYIQNRYRTNGTTLPVIYTAQCQCKLQSQGKLSTSIRDTLCVQAVPAQLRVATSPRVVPIQYCTRDVNRTLHELLKMCSRCRAKVSHPLPSLPWAVGTQGGRARRKTAHIEHGRSVYTP